jgi:hypothetical protein
MTRAEAEELILESNPEALFFDGYDGAIIGITERINQPPLINYSKEKIIEILAKDMEPDENDLDGRDIEDVKYEMALDFYGYNVEGAYMGEHTPLITTTTID